MLLARQLHLSTGEDGPVPLQVRRAPQQGAGARHAPPLDLPGAAVERHLIREEINGTQEVRGGGSSELRASSQRVIGK